MLDVLMRVFRQPKYFLIAVTVTFVVFSAAILLPNIPVLLQVLGSGAVALGTKVTLVLSLYGSLLTNYSALSASYMVAAAILFGLNSTLLVFYIANRRVRAENYAGNAATVAGMVAGVFGIGCAACGSIIISAFLALFGASGLLLLLPLQGAEFGLLAVGLLGFSVYQLTQRINDPLICEIA